MKSASVILGTVLFLNSMLTAAFGADSPAVLGGDSAAAHYNGLLIDSLEIDNRNIYDTGDRAYDRFWFRLANKLHIKTRRHVIERELLLKKGQQYNHRLAEETARNIRNSLVVYDAWTEVEMLPGGGVLLRVVTVDQWSLTGGFSYGREGNETRYQIGFDEKNFLGNNQLVSFYFFGQSDDEDFIEAAFFDNRFLGRRYRLQLSFSTNPVSEIESIELTRPYYDREQAYAYGVAVTNFSGRRDVYSDSLKIGESFFDGDVARTFAAYRFGDPQRKVTLELDYKYRYERTTDIRVLSAAAGDSALVTASLAEDSLYHEVEVSAGYADYEFIKLSQIEGFGYTEDFTLGYSLAVAYSRAFEPSFGDHVFDKAYLQLLRYIGSSRHLLLLDYRHVWWFRGSIAIRHSAVLSGRYYARFKPYLTLAMRGLYESDWNRTDREGVWLGGTTGVRGYDKYFRTGDRKVVGNVEARFYPDIRFMSAIFGGVVFADWGTIWKKEEPVTLGHTYLAAGFGLRIAFEKSTRNVVRIDLAYSEMNRWQLSIGTDQYFKAWIFE
ncbi:MAG: BamA/TamA family outer membrane protein [Candidatus Zixiibacteriota bacterium]|nr:MAG: BamA/TamA family outer membrane protein [candidate division Zixibacteria bacterium]